MTHQSMSAGVRFCRYRTRRRRRRRRRALTRGPRSPWRGRLTRAALPLLSVRRVRRRVAARRRQRRLEPDVRAVSRDGVARLRRRLHHPRRGPRLRGYLLWEHLYMTLRRVLVGVVIGVVLGVLLGLVMGSVGWVRSVLEPWLTFLRALPPLAYFFLLVIWLGIDEAPKITLLALAALPPAAVATTAAVVAAPVGLQEAAQSSGCVPPAGHPRRRRPVGAARDVHRASGSRWAWPIRRWSPPSSSTASPVSAAWWRTTGGRQSILQPSLSPQLA